MLLLRLFVMLPLKRLNRRRNGGDEARKKPSGEMQGAKKQEIGTGVNKTYKEAL